MAPQHSRDPIWEGETGSDEFLLCSLFSRYQTSNLKLRSFGAKNSSAVRVVIWSWGKKKKTSKNQLYFKQLL